MIMSRVKQSRQLSLKILVLILVAAVSMAIMAFLLSSMQTDLYLDSYTNEMKETFDELPTRLRAADVEVERNTYNFDETYKSLADSIAFIANHDETFRTNNITMRELKALLNVDNILVVDREGNVIASAEDTRADYSSSRFNQLRTVFKTGRPSEAVDIESSSKNWNMRYYAAKIDFDTMIVIEQDPSALRELIEQNGSKGSVLQNIDVGQSGYVFAISAKDYLFEYYPGEGKTGSDALDAGVDVADLEDGAFSWMTIYDEQLYCGVTKIGDTYYVAAVPRSDMTSTRNLTVAVILFAFFVVIAIVVMYGIFVMREDERQGTDPSDVQKIGPFRINKNIVRRAAVLSTVGFLAILVVSFYMQTLFALSSQSVSNNKRVNDIVENMDQTSERVEELSDEYGERYLPVCLVIGYMLDNDPELMNRNDLQTIADMLNVQTIFIYDTNGKLIATNSAYTKYVLSDDEEDASYEFTKLLRGGSDTVIQLSDTEDNSGDLWQYIGTTLHDEDGFINGLVQIAIRPTLLEYLLESADIDNVLNDIKVGSNGFAFAVNKEDDTFACYPINSRSIGESVYDHGMTKSQVKEDFNDYLTIDGVKYYAASSETDDYLIYLAGTEGELMAERLPLTAVTGAVALVCLIVIFMILIIEPKRNMIVMDEDGADGSGGRVIEREMPDGRKVRTETAASRWLNSSLQWNEKSAWQKTVTILRWLMAIMVVVVTLAVLFKDNFFESNSIFAYILGNNWERGLNVFAITACLMFICVATTAVSIVQRLLRFLSSVLSARGETICRMLRSLIRYATLIGMTYYCLLLLGVDGTTLLASAGILSVAISLGARELVEDIISGIFIIFEGEFRVGDIVTVGGYRGTVVEIGIRTTKIEEPGQNVKVIRNSEVNDVINMTKKLSYCSVDYSIEYGESLEHVEAILAKELPLIPERLPAIQNGPFYRGVSSLGDSSVNIRISMQCLEKDRMQLERDFNREMRLIFDRNHINIPFPQIVVNPPYRREETTQYEKWQASEFNKEQKEASKDLGEGNANK